MKRRSGQETEGPKNVGRRLTPLRTSLGLLSATLMLVLMLVCGCGTPTERVPGILASSLAGTDDVELTYEIDPTARPSTLAHGAFGEDLRALILRRLSAGQVGADVAADAASDRRARVIVDESLGARVDELVTWTGTLLVLDPAPEIALTTRNDVESRGLKLHVEGTERWYEGARADVLREVEAWPIDKEHLILAEPMWASSAGRQPPLWRTRVVRSIPVGELGDGAMIGWGDGALLRVRGQPGTLAESVITNARERPATPVVARGRVSLGAPRFESDSLLLSFGSGAEAYARAQHERRLLMTPRLPPLRRLGSVGLPPNRALALACLIVPILLSIGWLGFVRRFDRAHPEPVWLIAMTFFLGVVSTVPAGIAELLLSSASPWLDPSLVTFGGQSFALPLSIVVFTVVVGCTEEGAKRLAAHFAIRRPEFDEPVDGIVYGIVASLGFAAAENVRYFAVGRLSAPLVIARCFMSVPAHMFFGAVWGYALGARLINPKTRAWVWLLLAATAHGLFDALLSTEGAASLAILLNVALASVFVALVRRALRHGVVAKEMLSIKPEERALFRVGRPLWFWTSAVVLHVLALGIFFLGAYYQLARHRPSATFVIGSSVMLALLAVAAFGVSATLPLDVAIDDYGVTFAGAARPWRKIRGYKIDRRHVALDCEAGPIHLGPAGPSILEAIVAALAERLGQPDHGDRLHTLESRDP